MRPGLLCVLMAFSQWPCPAQVHYTIPKSGSLVVTTRDPVDDKRVIVRIVDPETQSWTDITSQYSPLVTYSPSRKELYISYLERNDSDSRAFLGIIDFTNARPPETIPYPGPRPERHARPELMLSPDGHWLYTLCSRLHPAQLNPASLPRGTVVNDLDCSYDEGIVYAFDLDRRRFLPRALETPIRSNPGAIFLAATSTPRQVDVYHVNAWIERYEFAEGPKGPARIKVTNTPITNRAGWRGNAYSVRSIDGSGPTYVVQPDGVVQRLQDTHTTFAIDQVPNESYLRPPALSGDGTLMFVPMALNPPKGVRHISVYRTGDFRKVREMETQEFVLSIASNRDGSILYYSSGSGTLRIVDATSLQLKKELGLSVQSILAIP